jgi:hypothetical protein
VHQFRGSGGATAHGRLTNRMRQELTRKLVRQHYTAHKLATTAQEARGKHRDPTSRLTWGGELMRKASDCGE